MGNSAALVPLPRDPTHDELALATIDELHNVKRDSVVAWQSLDEKLFSKKPNDIAAAYNPRLLNRYFSEKAAESPKKKKHTMASTLAMQSQLCLQIQNGDAFKEVEYRHNCGTLCLKGTPAWVLALHADLLSAFTELVKTFPKQTDLDLVLACEVFTQSGVSIVFAEMMAPLSQHGRHPAQQLFVLCDHPGEVFLNFILPRVIEFVRWSACVCLSLTLLFVCQHLCPGLPLFVSANLCLCLSATLSLCYLSLSANVLPISARCLNRLRLSFCFLLLLLGSL